MAAYLSAVALIPAPQQLGPDLSGRWTREAASAPRGAGDGAGLGPRVAIEQTDKELTIHPVSGSAPQRYSLDDRETVESLSRERCAQESRVTRAERTTTGIGITTWRVKESMCPHDSSLFRPTDQEERAVGSGHIMTHSVRHGGTRVLESVTNLRLDGDQLVVETTRFVPGSAPDTSTSRYRR